MGEPDDRDLLERARAGDTSAYGLLYVRHRGAAESLARFLTRSPDEAADLVADAFARVLWAIHGGHGPTEGFRPYLLTTVRRTAWRRQARARQVCLVEDGELDLPDLRVEMELLDPTDDDTMLRAFRSLPERWQRVLWHTIVLGRSVGELAAELGLSPNATSALGVRAREGLRKAYLRANGAEAAFATAA